MSQKNLNVPIKTHNFLQSKLKDKLIYKIYKKFEKILDLNENFAVAVSGGPDSLALAFLTKLYSINKFLRVRYFIVDHKLRLDSSKEANLVKKILNKISIHLKILTWTGTKPKTNIQSISRNKRYSLLIAQSKKFKIKNILLGHHLDDLIENFFIRILRGSGLNGLISLDKKVSYDQINFLRPLINFNKKDLIYVTEKVFGSYISDPSNENIKFKRVKIRKLLAEFQNEGFDKKKFFLTINNLKYANESITFYIKKNLEKNCFFFKKKNLILINKNFFQQSQEVIFRSFAEVIKIVGKKYYFSRGKKLIRVINTILNSSFDKTTLGGCIIQRVANTIIITKEP